MKIFKKLVPLPYNYLWQCGKRFSSSRNILKLNERGMYQDIFPKSAANEILNTLNGSPQCVYAGFDPTAESLHVGNLLVIINLLHWQRGGHNVIALLGGATGHIGDPSGRSTDRIALQEKILKKNIFGIKNNLETVFENHKKYIWSEDEDKLKPVRILNNEEWYKKIDSIKFVSDIGRNFRMGTMLLKQSVQNRINSEVGMSFTEFSYQIFQSYNWLHLLNKYDCRFQIGGSDQMGNISAGHELISRTAKKNVYGLTLPLVTTEEGDKFGKSAGNAMWLDPSKTSPYSLYQFFIRTKDTDVERLLKLFTFYSLGEIRDIMYKHKQHPEQRYPQQCLSEQLVTLVHGEEGLERAKKATEAIFSKDIASVGVKSLMTLTSVELEQVFDGASIVHLLLSPGITVMELGMKAKCFPTQNYRNSVIVARNPGSAKKATSYAERLRLAIAVIHEEQKEAESDEVDGRYSPPCMPSVDRSRTMDVSVGVPVHPAKEKPPINVVGDVGGRIAIMVDDMIDDVQSFVAAAEVLKECGAYKIYVLATHGLLSSDAPRLIEDSPIDEVVVTNTVPHELQKMQCNKIKTIDISVLLSEAIRRIHNKESMSYLFKNVTLED